MPRNHLFLIRDSNAFSLSAIWTDFAAGWLFSATRLIDVFYCLLIPVEAREKPQNVKIYPNCTWKNIQSSTPFWKIFPIRTPRSHLLALHTCQRNFSIFNHRPFIFYFLRKVMNWRQTNNNDWWCAWVLLSFLPVLVGLINFFMLTFFYNFRSKHWV